MADVHPIEESTRCQARPAAARPGYREDMLCASTAKTTVTYRGVQVPVCRIHSATYAAWGEDADEHAEQRWAWNPETVLTVELAELADAPPRRPAQS